MNRDPGRAESTSAKYRSGLVARWVAGYVVAASLPLLLAVVGPVPAARSFMVELGVALGFVAIGMLAVQFALSGRFPRVAPTFGADVVLQFHRKAGLAALVLVLAHPVVLIASEPDYLRFFDPRVNLPRAAALSVVVTAAGLLLVTSLRRLAFRLQYEHWRVVHGGLAALVLFIGIVHGFQVGHHVSAAWEKVVWVGGLGLWLSLVGVSRLVRPWRSRRHPYRVSAVRSELADVTTITLEPDGHSGMTFRAGQFAWITLGDTPFRLQQHPFSFSSSERERALEFTSKAVGDFTATWPEIEPGTRAYLEGPYGGFTLDPDAGGAVLIAGGIGITPVLSILRTAADDADPRSFTLLYATASLERAPFRAELRALSDRLDLTVHHVLEHPPTGWDGPSGYLDDELLDRYLPADRLDRHFFVCGPEPMMDACEPALRRLGVSWRRIYTERFQVV